jgi:hypothetical protein
VEQQEFDQVKSLWAHDAFTRYPNHTFSCLYRRQQAFTRWCFMPSTSTVAYYYSNSTQLNVSIPRRLLTFWGHITHSPLLCNGSLFRRSRVLLSNSANFSLNDAINRALLAQRQ